MKRVWLVAVLGVGVANAASGQGAAAQVNAGISASGTSGVYFDVGVLMQAEACVAIERRDRGISPVAAVSLSAGRSTQGVGGFTCPLIPGFVCTPPDPLGLVSSSAWVGLRGDLHPTIRWRGLIGVGGLRFFGEDVSPDGRRVGRYDGQSYVTTLRGEVEFRVDPRFGVLFAAHYADAPRVEAGMRATGGSIAIGLR
jgi:hypothetical protein